MDVSEATEAPTIPRGGINTMLRITFVITQTKPAHIKNLVLPMTIIVLPFGPTKLLIENPTAKICKAVLAGI